MPLQLQRPFIYLITSGATTPQTTHNHQEFSNILRLVEAAVASKVSLVQLREKTLSTRVLYELTLKAAHLTKGTSTRLLVNDRFDVALAAGTDGVQLTSTSMPTNAVRETCGRDFLIGVSTHSLAEARVAEESGADFVLFGPVFETESKRAFGEPQGVEKLREVARALSDVPVIAIGGVSVDNAHLCFAAGAAGVAGISMLSDAESLTSVVDAIRSS